MSGESTVDTGCITLEAWRVLRAVPGDRINCERQAAAHASRNTFVTCEELERKPLQSEHKFVKL